MRRPVGGARGRGARRRPCYDGVIAAEG